MFKSFSTKHIAIILVIALICIAGIISCGDFPTEAEESFSVDSSELPENNPTTNNGKPAPESTYPNSPRNWHDSTYREVYVPFAGVYYNNENGERQWNRAIVSYMDSNTLTQLWKDQMDAKGKGEEYDFFLRNLRNTRKPETFKNGNDYYFFDADFNIRFKKVPEVILKKLVGAVLTFTAQPDVGSTGKGTMVIGGLYQTMVSGDRELYDKVDYDAGAKLFMNGRANGDLEVLIMNVGASDKSFTSYGLDMFYYDGSDNYDKRLRTLREEWYSELRPPELVFPKLTQKYLRDYQGKPKTEQSGYFYWTAGLTEIARYRESEITSPSQSSKSKDLSDPNYAWSKGDRW